MLLIFNLIFLAIGAAFLTIGIYGMTVFKNFFAFAPSTQIYVPFICIGLFMMIVGIMSLWCTPKGVIWCLYLYSIIVFVLFVAVLALSALFVVKRSAVDANLKSGIESAMSAYPDETSIDLLQQTLHCCGSVDYTNWFKTKWANGNKSVPQSCCINNNDTCIHMNLPLSKNATTDIYTDGCYNKMHTTIEEKFAIIGSIGFLSSILIFCASLLACGLARNLKQNNYENIES